MTTHQLEKLVAEWQHRLRLDDWDIEVVAVGADNVDYQRNNMGLSYTYHSNHSAKILIATNRDIDDIHESVIHELLHVVFVPLRFAHQAVREQLGTEADAIALSQADNAEEVAVSALAKTLLRLHRGEN